MRTAASVILTLAVRFSQLLQWPQGSFTLSPK